MENNKDSRIDQEAFIQEIAELIRNSDILDLSVSKHTNSMPRDSVFGYQVKFRGVLVENDGITTLNVLANAQ